MKDEKLCAVLACVFSRKVLTPELEERLGKQGVNLAELRACIGKA